MHSQAAFGPPFFSARMPLLLAALAAAGCATERAYPGPRLAPAERAIVQGDAAALAGGLPVQVRLRKANEHALPPGASRAELPAGTHVLLVDCAVAGSGETRRFVVEAELEAGRSYRLVAVATGRNCDGIELVPR